MTPTDHIMCVDCAESHARQRVAAALEKAAKIADDAIDPDLAGSEEAYANDVADKIAAALRALTP